MPKGKISKKEADEWFRKKGIEPTEDIHEELAHLQAGFDLQMTETKEKLHPMWKKYGVEDEGALLQIHMGDFKRAIEECDGTMAIWQNGNILRVVGSIAKKMADLSKRNAINEEASNVFFNYVVGCEEFIVDSIGKFNAECLCQKKV